MTTPAPNNPPFPPAPPSVPTPAGGTPAVLSRDLADFLVEFSIALQKHAIYPAGHPLLNSSVENVVRRLDSLLVDRMSLAIGVARRQLVIEGVATDPSHPLLQELAGKLHRHHLGAVKFTRGIERGELADSLSTLGAEGVRGADPLGLTAAEVSARWCHVRIFPLTYDRLELLDQVPDEAPKDDSQMRASRAAELWVGLARAALMADTANDDAALEPTAVAKAIDEHAREQAYDQVIVGYLLQIAQEIKVTQGKEAAALQRRVSKMVSALNPETLKRLLDMGGDVQQRRRFVLDAAQGMTVEAVVDLVKAAADAEGQTVSNSFIRMLSKLALHARADDEGGRRALAEGALRDQVTRLLGHWSDNDANPTTYRLALEHLSRTAPSEASIAIPNFCEPERLVKMAVEVGATGPKVEHAVEKLASQGNPHVAALLDVLEGAPDGSPVSETIWQQLVKRETLRQLVSATRVDPVLVERFAKRQGFGAATVLLDSLAAVAESGGKWHDRLVDIIASLGDGAAPAVLIRMRGAPWQLQRDYLAILARLPTPPRGFDASGFLKHAEPSVRREAARLLLRMPELRDRSMITALADSDDRVLFIALNAALEHCSGGAARLIMRRAEQHELKDSTLRVLGVRAVAAQQTEESLDWLVRRVVTRTRWLKRLKLAARSAETLAALAAIAGLWRDHPKSATALALAAKSVDSEVRLAITAGAVRVHRREAGSGKREAEGGGTQDSPSPARTLTNSRVEH
ncbi:MAG: hypothetical protein M3303_03305 [Gemmatimonadota bacterium]|nr:hypothetical protein [Gemmatimonadota bacterium]